MKKQFTFSRLLITGLLIFPLKAFACIPHSSNDVFIARFQAAQKITVTNNHQLLTWTDSKFIFRDLSAWFKYSKAKQWQSYYPTDIDNKIDPFRNLKKNDLIIGLAYAPDENQPQNYRVTSFAYLKCQNNQITMSHPVSHFTAWDRKNKRCYGDHPKSIQLLDGFLKHDQSYYLKKLRAKYPTCQTLFSAFPKS